MFGGVMGEEEEDFPKLRAYIYYLGLGPKEHAL
jgi:hypothetical protein